MAQFGKNNGKNSGRCKKSMNLTQFQLSIAFILINKKKLVFIHTDNFFFLWEK